jgi:hypothetical protein
LYFSILLKRETADFETSKDFTRLQHLGLQIFERLQKTSKDFSRLQETSSDFMTLHETSADFNRLHETSKDFMRLHIQGKISGFQDFKRLQKTS